MIDPEGFTFEKAAIEQWIRINRASPVTRTPLTVEQLYDNTTLLRVMEELAEEDEDVAGPSIRKWKEDSSIYTAPVFVSAEIEPQDNFPTTQEQRRRRRQEDRSGWTAVSILLACMILFMFFPGVFLCLSAIVVLTCFVGQFRERRRRQVAREAAIQHLQEWEQEQQQGQDTQAHQQSQQPEEPGEEHV